MQGSGVYGVRRVLHLSHGPRAAKPCHGAQGAAELQVGVTCVGTVLCWATLFLVPQILPILPDRREGLKLI